MHSDRPTAGLQGIRSLGGERGQLCFESALLLDFCSLIGLEHSTLFSLAPLEICDLT